MKIGTTTAARVSRISADNIIERMEIFLAATGHYRWSIRHATIDAFGVARAELESKIREAAINAGAYNQNEVVPTEDIVNDVLNVVADSAEYYAFACALYKYQSSRELKDVFGNPVRLMLNNIFIATSLLGVGTPEGGSYNIPAGTWAISNSQWVQEVLDPLSVMYVRPDMAKLIHKLCSKFLQLKAGFDDGALRIISLDPTATVDALSYPLSNASSFISYKNNILENLRVIMAKYPFLDQFLRKMGLVSPLSAGDLTRPLSGAYPGVWLDTSGEIDRVIYSLSGFRYDDDRDVYDIGLRFYRTAETDYVFFKNDDERKAGVIDYKYGTTLDSEDWSGMLRGNVSAQNLCFMRKDVRPGQPATVAYRVMSPVPVDASVLNYQDDATETISALKQAAAAGMYRTLIDMPGDIVFVVPTSLSRDPNGVFRWTTAETWASPSAGDQILNEDDASNFVNTCCAYWLLGMNNKITDGAPEAKSDKKDKTKHKAKSQNSRKDHESEDKPKT